MSRLALLVALSAALVIGAPGPAAKPSALDKPTLEAYVRHLFVWGPQIHVEVGDPKPSQLPGFYEVTIHASAGSASQDFPLMVSKDGRHILQGNVYDVTQNPFKPDLDKLKPQFQPSFGTPGAPVVLVEFTDFECPFCKEEAKLLRENVKTAYPKQVRLYFMDYPLTQIHPWAKAAAVAGRCIFKQNANLFWDYHDWIFEHQGEINPDNLKSKVLEFAKGKEIDALQLERCMETKAAEADVDKSIAAGKSLNVTSTPTLFINGRRIVGRSDWPTLRNVIDYEIEYQKTAKNAGEDCGCEVKIPTLGQN
ncbi:MAG TPA: DsbA family protein [Bryobacteraceae bacterium]|nr:DsbA family protein [Bryobacteraceae bacterium]